MQSISCDTWVQCALDVIFMGDAKLRVCIQCRYLHKANRKGVSQVYKINLKQKLYQLFIQIAVTARRPKVESE